MEIGILYYYCFVKYEINCVGISAQKVGKMENLDFFFEFGNDMLKRGLVKSGINFTLRTIK